MSPGSTQGLGRNALPFLAYFPPVCDESQAESVISQDQAVWTAQMAEGCMVGCCASRVLGEAR